MGEQSVLAAYYSECIRAKTITLEQGKLSSVHLYVRFFCIVELPI